MSLSPRQLQLLSLIETQGTVRTIELATQFQVTDETIRRDLQALSDAGLAYRVHGGATSLSGRPRLTTFNERRNLNVSLKRAIATAALPLISPGDIIAFDGSTTVFELVKLLPDEPLRVITNAHPVAHHLVDANEIELIHTGGRYEVRSQSYVGGKSLDAVRKHNIQKAIISCVGIDLDKGISETFEEQAIFKEGLVQHAQETILLADSTKLNHRSEYFFSSLSTVKHLVTDNLADPRFIDAIRAAGIGVTLAEIPASSES